MEKRFRDLDFDPRNLPEPFLIAIGQVCANYCQTEDHVQMAIAGILGVDGEVGWAITTHMNAPLRQSVIKSLSQIAFIELEDVAQLDELLIDIEKAAKLRNNVAHGLWCSDEQTGDVFNVQTSARTAVIVDLAPVRLETLKEDAEFIYRSGMALISFLIEKNLLPALPPRDRDRRNKRALLRAKKKGKRTPRK